MKAEDGKVVEKPAPRGRPRLRLKRRRLQWQRPHRPRLFRVPWLRDVLGVTVCGVIFRMVIEGSAFAERTPEDNPSRGPATPPHGA